MVELVRRFLGVNGVKIQTKAFTLAELLITMLIFGILAVMIVPNVTQNAEKELFVTQLKKVQNDIQQAMLVMISQNQGSLRLFCSGADSSKCFRDIIADKLLEKNVKFEYEDGNGSVCQAVDKTNKKSDQGQACAFIDRKPLYLNKTNVSLKINATNTGAKEYYAAYLKNGATISVIFNRNCNGAGITDDVLVAAMNTLGASGAEGAKIKERICGYMEIDTNAGKIPNMVGKDIHYFWIIDQDGIIPFGEIDGFTCGTVNNGTIGQKPDKTNTVPSQLGCTARMLQRNRIDFY